MMNSTRSALLPSWVWSLLSIHLLFLVGEMVSLAAGGHFQVSRRADLVRALGIGAAGYGLLFFLEVGTFWLATRIVRIEPRSRRAVQLALTTLLILLFTDHVGRHWIDTPFAKRSFLILALAVTGSVLLSWIFAVGLPRLLPRRWRARLAGPLPSVSLMSALGLLLWLFPVHDGAANVASAGGPNVILISIDTARADFLSSYGFPAPSTPALDRLAARGAQFMQAYSPENWTLPAHASMLTSLYPPTHGVEALESRLADGISTLAEIYREHGYRTLGIVDGDRRGFVGASRGFDRGFEHYVHYPEGKGVRQAFLPFRAQSNAHLFFEVGHADDIVDSAIRWIEQTHRPQAESESASPPFFLFMHIYDVHSSWGARWPLHRLPYQAHPEMLIELGFSPELSPDRFVRDGLSGSRYLRAINRALDDGTPLHSLISPEEAALLRALYASSLHFVDQQIARLDRFLEDANLRDSTLLVVTSDHGEEFLEHGRFGHHQDHRETLHIPLLLRWPERIAVRQIHELVGMTDLAPTLLDLCGLPVPDSFQGRSLTPLLNGARWEPGAVFMGNQLDDIFGVRTGTFSYYVRGPRNTDRPGEELYDVRTDPEERYNLRDREPATLDTARVLVAEWLHRTLQDRAPGAGPANPLDAQTRELLRSLGYTD